MPTAVQCVNCRYLKRESYEGYDFSAQRHPSGHVPKRLIEWNACKHPALTQKDEYGPMDFQPPDGFGCVLGEARDGNPTG
jgi:hypothetical protein